ncbi:MAG: MBL fold metallo-hydrolase [Pelagimonas sp.]
MPTLSRRAALLGAATLPLTAQLARADGHAAPKQQGAQIPRVNRFQLGAFEVSTLLVGSRTVEGPKNIFGMNVDAETFATASAEAHLPTDKAQFFFTPTLVNTGKELILFDTGFNAGGITAAVEAAGYTADQVSHVVITHMHGDHIGGLTHDQGATFKNAAYVTGQVEFDAWAKMENDGFDAKVRPLADQTRFVGDGDSVASGVNAVAAFGHTPGHMTYMLESEGKQLLLMADLANHYVWSLAYPDWEVKFDRDKAAAAASRRKVLGMLAAEKMPFVGYHMPFPALGYAETRGDGFHYVPHSYQLML